jgi:microcin C transport system substrate-binding protein
MDRRPPALARRRPASSFNRIKEFSPGRSIVYERVKDYWGQAVNVNIGRDNFDELRFEYFRDGTVAVEAFKADVIDWRIENSAKNWPPPTTSRRSPTGSSSLRNFPSKTSA